MLRSDEELMLSCRDGDEGAFEILYRRYQKPILSFVYRMVANTADAEDLCQETFLKLMRARKRYRPSGKFKTWLFRIALNLCRDRIRRMKFRSNSSLDAPVSCGDCENAEMRQTVSDLSSDPAKRAETDEMRRLVQQAFSGLTEGQRTVVILRQYHALKFPEIAEVMKRPLATVKSLNHRGQQRLLEVLSEHID